MLLWSPLGCVGLGRQSGQRLGPNKGRPTRQGALFRCYRITPDMPNMFLVRMSLLYRAGQGLREQRRHHPLRGAAFGQPRFSRGYGTRRCAHFLLIPCAIFMLMWPQKNSEKDHEHVRSCYGCQGAGGVWDGTVVISYIYRRHTLHMPTCPHCSALRAAPCRPVQSNAPTCTHTHNAPTLTRPHREKSATPSCPPAQTAWATMRYSRSCSHSCSHPHDLCILGSVFARLRFSCVSV